MSQLRIAFFVTSFPNLSETFVIRQVASLLIRGHRVHVVAGSVRSNEGLHPELAHLSGQPRFSQTRPPNGRWKDVLRAIAAKPRGAIRSTFRLEQGIQRSATVRLAGGRALARHYRNLVDLWLGGLLSRFVPFFEHQQPFDVLHAHFGDVGRVVAALKYGYRWNVPLVVTFHGSDANVLGRSMPLSFYRIVFEEADRITCGTEFLRQRLLALGAPEAKLRINPMGVPLDGFSYVRRSLGENEPLRLLSVGRLIEAKGHATAIQAVAKLRDDGVAVHYTIVGDGPQRERLLGMIDELSLESSVTLCGALDGGSVREQYRNAHVFIHPSVVDEKGTEEQQSVVMVEAQATGLPVIASDIGGVSSTMVDGKSGFLVPQRDVDAIVDAVRHIQTTYSDVAYGEVGRSHVEQHFSHESCMDGLLAIYEECIAMNRAGIPT